MRGHFFLEIFLICGPSRTNKNVTSNQASSYEIRIRACDFVYHKLTVIFYTASTLLTFTELLPFTNLTKYTKL